MDEKKRQEMSEEMSLEELKKKAGGTKGSCGFTDETGHCGFTCETDGEYHPGDRVRIHCPNCWSGNINTNELDTESYNHQQNVYVCCNDCGNSWRISVFLYPPHNPIR